MLLKYYFLLILVGLGFIISSCGQKGDLVRPQPPSEQSTPSQEMTDKEKTPS